MERKISLEYPANSVRLCFDMFGNEGGCKGNIYGIALQEGVSFASMEDLIVKIDDVFNVIGQPQPHQVLRSFAKEEHYRPYCVRPKHCHPSKEIAEKHGKILTLDFVMRSRHKAEWQGTVYGVNDPRKFEFHTTLECITGFGEMKR